jgi:hypothetical protein
MEFDIQTTVGQIIVCLMAGFAQTQVDQMRITATEGRGWLLENGYATGHPPFGFHNVSLRKLPGQKKARKITVPIQPEVVDEIVLRLDGGEKMYSVAADFARRGLRCRKKLWAPARNTYHVSYKRIRAAYKFWKENSAMIAQHINHPKSSNPSEPEDFGVLLDQIASEADQSPERFSSCAEQSEQLCLCPSLYVP